MAETKKIITCSLGLALALSCLSSSACQRQESEKTRREAPDQQAPNDLDAPLAKVDGEIITVREFQDRINRQSPYVRGRYTSLEHKKEFLTNLIRFEVLALEAKKRGLDKDPDAVRAMKQVMIQKLMREQFAKDVAPESITEAELRAYYTKNANLYNKPEEVRVAAIIMTAKAAAARVAKTAAAANNKVFRELVTKHSTDEKSRKAGGDLRYFSRENKEIPRAVIDAAFSLTKTGDVAGPIAAGGKHYIIKQTGKRRAMVKEFEKVAPQIRSRLAREKRKTAQRDFINRLKRSTKVEVFEKNLKKVRVDTRKGAQKGHGTGIGPGNVPAMPPATPSDPLADPLDVMAPRSPPDPPPEAPPMAPDLAPDTAGDPAP